MTINLTFVRIAYCSILSVIGTEFLQPLRADVIGDPVVARPQFDGGTGQLFIYAGHFAEPGARVTSWSFWSDAAASNNCSTGQASYVCSPGATITPVILSINSPGSFSVTGIGTTRANSLTGLQTFAFDAVAGSNLVSAQSTFGFRSGGPTDTGNFDFGVVDFDNASSLGYYSIGERTIVTLGATYTGTSPARAYSIDFTATATPEPSGLLSAGLVAALTVGRVRQRRARVTKGRPL